MGYNNKPHMLLALSITVAIMLLGVSSELSQDIKGCQDSMSDLYSCLPFVTTKAKAPDSTCCTTLKEKLDKGHTKRCLCTLVKEKDDPGLGFKVDANRAMSLPSTCLVPANISQCPGDKFSQAKQFIYGHKVRSFSFFSFCMQEDLLHLPPDSPLAKIFKQFAESTQNVGSRGTNTAKVSKGSSFKGRDKTRFMVGCLLVWYLVSYFVM
ncbi:unnamed protein product [Cochlearia groenlandica]